MSQRDKAKVILEELKNRGFHPEGVKYQGGYFLFDFGKDMVVHFRLKECKGWLFAIWWNVDDKNQFDFFTQFEKNIDKFKPTASNFVQTDISYAKKDARSIVDFYLLPIIKFIRNHKYVAWCYDNYYYLKSWQYMTGFEAWREYTKYSLKYYRLKPLVEKRMVKRWKKIMRGICDQELENYAIVDDNVGGVICYPRFHIVCENFKEEKVEKGYWTLEIDEQDVKLKKKIDRFNKKLKRMQKRFGHMFDVDEIRTHIGVVVNGKRLVKQKKK